MAQNYLVVGVYRPDGVGVTHEHITKLVYYDPAKEKNYWTFVKDAIKEIDEGKSIYFVHEGGKSTNLKVIPRGNTKYVRTNGDSTTKDNLLKLTRYEEK
ncbi:MAG: DUF3892 domain-containing protein [Sphingobacteriales bacterium]